MNKLYADEVQPALDKYGSIKQGSGSVLTAFIKTNMTDVFAKGDTDLQTWTDKQVYKDIGVALAPLKTNIDEGLKAYKAYVEAVSEINHSDKDFASAIAAIADRFSKDGTVD